MGMALWWRGRNQQGHWRAGRNQQRYWRALARSRHWRALARSEHKRALARSEHKGALGRSGLWGWAPTHPLVCHQQAQGHMSLCRWACGLKCAANVRGLEMAANGGLGEPRTATNVPHEWQTRMNCGRWRRSSILLGRLFCHTPQGSKERGVSQTGVLMESQT